MLQGIVARRAAEISTRLARGMFDEASVPLRNGGTLPATMFARVALDDLAYLSRLGVREDEQISGMSWQQLAKDIELLHEVALARGYAAAQHDRARA